MKAHITRQAISKRHDLLRQCAEIRRMLAVESARACRCHEHVGVADDDPRKDIECSGCQARAELVARP